MFNSPLLGAAFGGARAASALGMFALGYEAALRGTVSPVNRYCLGCFGPKGFEPKAGAEWTVKNAGDGTATVDLGNYELKLDEKNSQIKIINKANGEVTNIWGDPHIDWDGDGKTDANFWGKTTFQLEDGTKITIDTEAFKNNPKECVASEITVTNGDRAMQIKGISQNELGDLKIETSEWGGQLLDWAVTDGYVVKENANGKGWLDGETGKLATQKDFDVTKADAKKPYEFTQKFAQGLGIYLLTGNMDGMVNAFVDAFKGGALAELPPPKVAPKPQPPAKPPVIATPPTVTPHKPTQPPTATPPKRPVAHPPVVQRPLKPPVTQPPVAKPPVTSAGMPDTKGMTTQQKYDVYARYIQQHGDARAKKDLADGKAVVLALRRDTPMNQGSRLGAYDDRMVVLQKTKSGPKVTELAGNTEPNRNWAEKMGGGKPVGRLATGQTVHYERSYNDKFRTHFRPIGSPSAQRDTNHNMRFDANERSYSGSWGGQAMLIHRGGVGNTQSQGCQTMAPAEYDRFLAALGSQSSLSYVLVKP